MTAQGDRQASVRAATGTALDYNGDWSALFDQAAIPAGPWDQRLLAWLNQVLVMNFRTLANAMQFFAISQGAFNWSSMGTFPAGGGGGYSPQASALFAQMTVQPPAARKSLINTCINALISAGVWAKLDVLWVLAAHDPQAGLLNWPAPTTYLLTNLGATWTLDTSYAGDAASTYLSSTYAPGFGGALAVQDNNCIGVVVTTAQAGAFADLGSNTFSIISRQSSTSINVRSSNTAANAVTTTPGPGHLMLNRTGSTGYDIYRNGAFAITQAQASLALTNFGFYVAARNLSGAASGFSGRSLAAVHAGQGLTATDIANLYTALNTYLAAI